MQRPAATDDCWRQEGRNRVELSDESFFAQKGRSLWYGFSVLVIEGFMGRGTYLVQNLKSSKNGKKMADCSLADPPKFHSAGRDAGI